MEAPTPNFVSKPTPSDNLNNQSSNNNENNNYSLIKKTEFKFLYKKKTFNVIVGMTDDKQNLIIQSKVEGIFTYFYEKSMSLNDLTQLDKQFRTCDDIEESFNLMVLIFKNEKNHIKEMKDNVLIISIHILNLDKTFRDKDLELFKKSQNTNIIIEHLCQQILELKENNIKLQKELKEVKEKVSNLEEKIKYKLSFLDSQIIQEKYDYDFIIQRLKKVNVNKNDHHINEIKKIVLKLLYRASKDGDSAKDFHLKCDNYKNTLIIIKTKKGLRFGGFTCESWEGKGDKKDENAFCFSLDKNKIYNWAKGKSSIFVSPENGPAFGNCIFEIKDQFFEMGGSCSEDYFYNNQEKQCEINNGEEEFDIEDIEVFNVSFQ